MTPTPAAPPVSGPAHHAADNRPRPNALRAGLVASGVAFSASLILSSIEHPVTDFDLPLPSIGRVEADRAADVFSEVLRIGMIGEARLMAVSHMLTEPGHQTLDAGQFLDYVAREIPEVHLPESSHTANRVDLDTTSQGTPAPAVVYQTPSFSGGGGGGGPWTPAPPSGPALPPLLGVGVWVWGALQPVLGSSTTHAPPAPPTAEAPQTSTAPTATLSTHSETPQPTTTLDDIGSGGDAGSVLDDGQLSDSGSGGSGADEIGHSPGSQAGDDNDQGGGTGPGGNDDGSGGGAGGEPGSGSDNSSAGT